MVTRSSVTVVVARFEDIVGRGLRALIDDEESLQLVAADVPNDALVETLELHRPRVAIVNFGSLTSPADVQDLYRGFPDTRLVVLANRPTPAECRQMLAFGATACLAKNTQARDVLHAIHLASRGMRVLPPVASDLYDASGPELLTPREADVLELLQSGRSNARSRRHSMSASKPCARTHARHVYRKLGVRTRRDLQARR